MRKIRMIIELEYDNDIMHREDAEAIDWFYNEILVGKGGQLILHSNEIGDEIGKVKGIKIYTPN